MPLIIVSENIPTLPSNCVVRYLDEGAANIVYRISIPPPSPSSSILEEHGDGTPPPSIIESADDQQSSDIDFMIFDGKLLRLRKNLATAPTCFASQAAYLRLIAPLFNKSQLVEQSLVKVNPTTLIQRLNFELEATEKKQSKSGFPATPRLAKRHGTYLAEDGYGLLVTDMTSMNGHTVIEFKPKWLSQSPSAPPNSRRCRQCAYIAHANAQHLRSNTSLLSTWCPLGLVSSDLKTILEVAERILHAHGKATPSTEQIEAFADWVKNTPLLRKLRDNQVESDSRGPLNADASDEKFRLAMTLRDVTVYLRFSDADKRNPSAWEARLGDLDIKSADKGPAWKEKERELIEGGWYEATEGGVTGREVSCYLERMGSISV